MESVHFHRRNLPHFYPKGAKFFITFRLYGSIPQAVLVRLKADYEAQVAEIVRTQAPEKQALLIDNAQKRHFAAYDQYLDKVKEGPHHLSQPEIAAIVKEALHYRDGKLYDLLAYCVMSNHVHLAIDMGLQLERALPYQNLDGVMGGLKTYTAIRINKALGREGHLWQAESFDRVIRHPKEMQNGIAYILNNPVKAGLVGYWEEYAHTYLYLSPLG